MEFLSELFGQPLVGGCFSFFYYQYSTSGGVVQEPDAILCYSLQRAGGPFEPGQATGRNKPDCETYSDRWTRLPADYSPHLPAYIRHTGYRSRNAATGIKNHPGPQLPCHDDGFIQSCAAGHESSRNGENCRSILRGAAASLFFSVSEYLIMQSWTFLGLCRSFLDNPLLPWYSMTRRKSPENKVFTGLPPIPGVK